MAEQKKKPGRPPGSTNKSPKNGTKKKATGGKSKRTKEELEKLAAKKRLRDEIWSIVLMALGAFLVVSLQTTAAGQFGHALQLLLKGCFGTVAYILPYYLIIYGLLLFTKHMAHIGARSISCLALIFLMLAILNSGHFLSDTGQEAFSFAYLKDAFDNGTLKESGGAFGMFTGLLLVKAVGKTGLYIFSLLVIVVSGLMIVNTPISQFIEGWRERRLSALAEKEEEEEALAEAEARVRTEAPVPKAAQAKKAAARKAAAIPIQDGTPAEADPAAWGKPGDNTPAPARIEPAKGMSPGQMKIIDYMKDETLFETPPSPEISLGLEAPSPPQPGMGLWEETPQLVASPSAALTEREEALAEECGEAPEAAEAIGAELFAAEPIPVPGEFNDPDPKEEIRREKERPQQNKAPERKEEVKSTGGGTAPKAYKTPPIDLLNKVSTDKNIGEQMALQAKAVKLEETLRNFGVNAKVLQVTKGPAVTRYEIQPNTGVKVSSIVRLADDIALNLEARSIRMEAPIPGKAAVGIEVENEKVNMVTIREIVSSQEFRNAKSRISFAVGKDIAGNSIVADLKGMPHLLIAGSTGSGKSVCINSLIISILYKAKPDEVKFVLIDPKVVELSNYNGIPHLLIPVVTDPGKAAAALNWAVAEMTDRYKKFAEEGVRDLAGFNGSVKEKGEEDRYLPQVVIIIDELADLMMAAPSQVEEAICRLAQMARAAGMHLIVATQRPSVDIITGVIKANIPSRIAFAVSSQFDSRTILDMAGAEKLVGKGDMLFNPLGMGKPLRVQGCFISDSEVHKVIEFLKNNGPETEYSSDVIHSIDRVQSDSGNGNDDGDELLADAIETVVRAEQASVSMIQRRFRVGYNRAARLVDMMEARGIIGPADGSRPRKVLLSLEELEAMKNGDEEEPAQ